MKLRSTTDGLIDSELSGSGGKAFVAIYLWDTSALNWVKATGGSGTGTQVEVTNFPPNPATSTLQTSGNSSLTSIDTKLTSQATAINQATANTSLNSLVAETATKFAFREDPATATVTYYGWALPGSAETSAVWRIMKMDTTSGTVTTWADGNSNFDNVWANRTTLTYT